MGNCISSRTKHRAAEDEESKRLEFERLLEAQKKALATANKELGTCNGLREAFHQKAKWLEEQLHLAEEKKREREQAHRRAVEELSKAREDLVSGAEAKNSADERIAALQEQIVRMQGEQDAIGVANEKALVKLQRECKRAQEEIEAQRTVNETAVWQKGEADNLLATVEGEIKAFSSDTLRLVQDLRWRENQFWREESKHDGQRLEYRLHHAEGFHKKPDQPILLELQRARNALAKELWVAGWVGEQWYQEVRLAKIHLDRSQKRVGSLGDSLEAEEAKAKDLSIEVARLRTSERELAGRLAEAQRRSEASKQDFESPCAPDVRDPSYSQPYRFSKTAGKDLRVKVCWWEAELRIDVRQFYGGRESTKGVSMPVQDAARLAKVLPDVVRRAGAMLR